jgi:hypothetical protein
LVWLLPILEVKSDHPLKLVGIVGDQNQHMGLRDRGNHQIICPNRRAFGLEVGPDTGILAGRPISKGEGHKGREKLLLDGKGAGRVGATERPKPAFRLDHGAHRKFCWRVLM